MQSVQFGEGKFSKSIRNDGKYQDVQFVNVKYDVGVRNFYTRFGYEGQWPQGKVILSDGKESSYEISPDVFALTTNCNKYQGVMI